MDEPGLTLIPIPILIPMIRVRILLVFPAVISDSCRRRYRGHGDDNACLFQGVRVAPQGLAPEDLLKAGLGGGGAPPEEHTGGQGRGVQQYWPVVWGYINIPLCERKYEGGI